MTAIFASAARTGRVVLDAVLPPRCLGCGVVVDAPGALCAGCWRELNFIAVPHCACCGLPFDYDAGDGALCGACSRAPPVFARARAALTYDDASRRLIIAFKHGDETHAARPFGRWVAAAAGPLLRDADLVAPVPLHRRRLFRRRYNQAALLAQAVAEAGGVAAVLDLLVRRRPTPSQGGRSRAGRLANVRGAFAVAPRHARRLDGRRVLLVDDVMTTGATADACAKALVRAGAAAVDVLTLARVVAQGD